MRRIVIGNSIAMITEIRREAPVFPEGTRRRGLMGLAILFLVVALFCVWLSGKYYRIGYDVSVALEDRQALQKEQALLKTEILTLRDPARIDAIARGQLGMVDPKTERIIRVK